MSTLRIATLAFGCSLIAAPAMAASDADMQASDSLKTAEGECGHFWTLVDTDNDAQVTTEEARAAVDRMMKSMDTDASGDVGPDEYAQCAERAEQAAYEEQQDRDRSEARFERYDTDNDGTVSVEEMLRGVEGEFRAADIDGDNQLTQDEMQAAEGQLTEMTDRADRNADDRLSADEMAAQVRREFLTTDRDKSGEIDIGEWTTLRQYAATEMVGEAIANRFQRIDANDDGVITSAEVMDYRTEAMGDTQQADEASDLGSVWIFRVYRTQ